MKLLYLYIISASIFFTTSCYLEVPVEEMSQAKASISRAREVKADKYAPEELKAAEDQLYLSHKQVKENEIAKARETVKESNISSDKAIEKALPPFSADALAEAKKAYEKADIGYSEKYAPDDLSSAGKAIAQAEELRGTKEYWESYRKSKEAIDIAAKAREKSLAHVNELQQDIKDMEGLSSEIAGIKEFSAAAGDLELLNSKLSEAGEFVNQENLKSAVPRIDEAKEIVNSKLAVVQKAVVGSKITAVKTEYAAKNTLALNEQFAADIDKADLLLKESEDLYQKEKYIESYKSSEKAYALLALINKSIIDKKTEPVSDVKQNVVAADKKIEPVIDVKKDVVIADKKNAVIDTAYRKEAWIKLNTAFSILRAINRYFVTVKIKEDLKSISAILNESRTGYYSNEFRSSIEKSNKALKQIRSVSIIIESEISKILEREKLKSNYTVSANPGRNECLWTISDNFYNDPTLWPILYVTNVSRISSPGLIKPGLTIDIPSFPAVVEKWGK